MLAPVLTAATAPRNSWDTFLIGMAATAGISMEFVEALWMKAA
jgi:hypothetical protein